MTIILMYYVKIMLKHKIIMIVIIIIYMYHAAAPIVAVHKQLRIPSRYVIIMILSQTTHVHKHTDPTTNYPTRSVVYRAGNISGVATATRSRNMNNNKPDRN